MKATSIQTVKLNIINKIGISEDKSLLQKVWDVISSYESNEQLERVYTKEEKEILNSIKKGYQEVQQIEKGILKATPVKDFLNEL